MAGTIWQERPCGTCVWRMARIALQSYTDRDISGKGVSPEAARDFSADGLDALRYHGALPAGCGSGLDPPQAKETV